ncbi:MAG TPA: tetratricopeptide repeat protein [Verrucomicrobiae bacterium]|nr:tetratricopeptide repeat protein [Verrucomicrobiae bacterium]
MTPPERIDGAADRRTAVSSPAPGTRLAQNFWFLALVLVAMTFAVYAPMWHAGFIWDDDDHLTANPVMTAPHGLRMIWSSLTYSRYYPLTLTTFWCERRLWGLDPRPYHVINIALQAINGVLVFLILRRLRVPGAWVAACLWAVHPVNVESVAWITELKNVQSGLFFFVSLLCFLRFERARRGWWYALALTCGAAAMLSKPSTVVLPLVLLLCAWWEHGAWRRRDLLRSVPFFLLACGTSLLAIAEQHGQVVRAGTDEWKLGMAERLIVAAKAIWFYAGKTLWPVDLIFVYPRWNVRAGSIVEWMPLAAAVVMGMALWKLRGKPSGRGALFGFAFFVVALLPVLGFFSVFYFRYSYVADHFQYLASIGLITLAVAVAGAVVRQPAARCAAGAIAVAAFGALSWRHAEVFHDEETLWRDVIARNPGCLMAHNNYATVLIGQGRWEEALQQCQQALQIKPDDPVAHDNWGSVLLKTGKPREAVEQYARAVDLKPDSAEAQYNYGNALFQVGRVEEAIGHYEMAARINPNLRGLQYNLGNALLHAGRAEEAIAHYERAVLDAPDNAEARNRLATALALVGRVQEAISNYERALELRPENAEAANNLAWLLATVPAALGGDPVRAVALAEQARGRPGRHLAMELDTLAVAYASAGRFDEAIQAAEECLALAQTAGQTQLVANVQAQIDLFRAGHPYRARADVK